MEHIVQFGINIDDEAIKKAVIHQTQQIVVNDLRADVLKEVTGNKEGNRQTNERLYSEKIKEYVHDAANDFFENNKDEIIELTASKLADKLVKTKAVREMVEKTLEAI